MTKNRILTITDCLASFSSKENPRTLTEINTLLVNEYGLEITLNALRKELEFLIKGNTPFELVKEKNRNNHQENVYYPASNHFAIHELRYLMDAVSAARFISADETRKLVYKLRALTDEVTSKRLANELVNSEGKVDIDHFSDNIQTIHEAIREKKCVEFRYGRYNVKKEFILSRDGGCYEVIPFGVIWSQEYYYLIGQERGKETKVHYRIDRMSSVSKTEETWTDQPGFELEKYVGQLFHMYSGEKRNIAIEFDNHLINVVIDRFGLGAKVRPLDDHRFLLEVEGVVSQGLVRWILTWGADAKAVRPISLVNMMKTEIRRYDGLYT